MRSANNAPKPPPPRRTPPKKAPVRKPAAKAPVRKPAAKAPARKPAAGATRKPAPRPGGSGGAAGAARSPSTQNPTQNTEGTRSPSRQNASGARSTSTQNPGTQNRPQNAEGTRSPSKQNAEDPRSAREKNTAAQNPKQSDAAARGAKDAAPKPSEQARTERARTEVKRAEQRRADDDKAREQKLIDDTRRRFDDDTRRVAEQGRLDAVLDQAYGDRLDEASKKKLVDDAKSGALPQPDNVRFVDPTTLNGNLGAYSTDDGGTVLLSRDLQSDPKHLDRVYREEVGHHLDRQLGPGDAKGDEGEIFARGVENQGPVAEHELARMKAEDDHGTVTEAGRTRAVENAGPQEIVRDGRPYQMEPGRPLSMESGGFPPGVGHLQGTPTADQVQNAVRYMDDQMRQVEADMRNARFSGDSDAYRQAFDKYRELEKGADALQQTIQHVAMVGLIDPNAMRLGADLYQQAEGGVLDNVGGYIQTFADGERPPDRQTDLDYLAQLSVGGKDAPPNTPMGDRTMAHKMWDQLQADANKPGNEALKAKLDAAANNAGQQAAQAKKLYEQALFEDDPAKRRDLVDQLEDKGSLFYGQHIQSLRATSYLGEDGRQSYYGLQSLQRDGNYFADSAMRRLGDDFLKRYGSDDPKVRKEAEYQLANAQRYLREIDNTDRTDFILHELKSDAPLADLTKARERLQTETARKNDVAERELPRVWTQENLTRLRSDPDSIDALKTKAAEGDAIARRTMSALLESPDGTVRGPDYQPVSMERGWSSVRVPHLDLPTLNRTKTAAAESLGTKTNRDEARLLAETVDRPSANPDVRRAAGKSIDRGLDEGNANTLAGMTDALVDSREDSFSRLSGKLRSAREVDGFDVAVHRLGRSAEGGNTRAIDAIAGVSTVDGGATREQLRTADRVEKSLVAAAKNGHANDVTRALLAQGDGGYGAGYYRALGQAAGELDGKDRARMEDVRSQLREGLTRGYDRNEVDPKSAHHGAAEGMVAIADRLGSHEALQLTSYLSPSTVDALGKISPKLSQPVAEQMMRSLRWDVASDHMPADTRNRAAEALGRMGKWADASDVDLLVQKFGKADDNRSAFSGVVNMLSRSDDARVRERAVHALMDDPKASWTNLSEISKDDRKRLVDYVAGTGDWELQGDIGKLVEGTGIRPPVPALFSRWGVEGDKDTIVRKSIEARGNYGDDAVRSLGGNVALWNRLSPDARTRLLGLDESKLTDQQRALIQSPLHTSWAADQMARGTLHEGHGKFLLDDLGGRVDAMIAEDRRTHDRVSGELRDLQTERNRHVADMTKTTTDGVGFVDETAHVLSYANPANLVYGRDPSNRDRYEDAQNADVTRLRDYDDRLRTKAAEVSQAARDRLFLENADAAYEREQLLADGRHVEASQVAFDQWAQHGDNLKTLDPEMYASIHRPDDAAGTRGDGDWTRLKAHDRFHLDQAPTYEGDGQQRFDRAMDVLGAESRGGERQAVFNEALKIVDGDENFARLNQAAGEIAQQLPTIQKMLASGAEGTAFEPFVQDVRDRARPLLNTLNQLRDDPQLLQQTEQRLQQLRDLEQKMGDHPAAERKQIQDRIKALDGMVKMAKDEHGVRGVLETVLDDSKFRADTWSNWAKYEGPKVAGALAVGVAAAAFTAATFGAGAPLAAVAFAGAVGGLAGHELMSDAMHFYRNNFDESVVSGNTFYSEKSRFSHWRDGDQVYDQSTKQWRDRQLVDDVLAPYALEVGQNFLISYASLGLGRAFAGGINNVMGKVMGNYADDFARMSPKLAQIEGVLGKEATQRTFTDILRQGTAQTLKELPQEAGEEAMENLLQKGLEQIDPRLGALSTVLLTTGKGIDVRVRGGGFEYDGKYAQQALDAFRAGGHDVKIDANQPGTITVDGVPWRARGDVDAAAWKRMADGPVQSTLPPARFETDPNTLRDRALAKRQLADRLQGDLDAGRIPDGTTRADLENRIRDLRQDSTKFDQRAAGAIDENHDPNRPLTPRANDVEYDGRPARTPDADLDAEAKRLAANLGLPPEAATDIVKYRKGLEEVSALVQKDPVAAAKRAEELANEWGLKPNPGDPIRLQSHELPALRAKAKEYAERAKAQDLDLQEDEILQTLVNEKFGSILKVGHGYNANAPDHRPKFPSDFTVNDANGKPRPLNLDDPAERTLAELHARAKIEEVMHSAGFSLGKGPGDYKPLFERTKQFDDWLKTDEGRAQAKKWLGEAELKNDDAAIDDVREKLLEADIMELHRSRGGFNEHERDRYPGREVYDRWTGEQLLREKLGDELYGQLDTENRGPARQDLIRATRLIGDDPAGQAALAKLAGAGAEGRLSTQGFTDAAKHLADFVEATGGRIQGDVAGRIQRIYTKGGDAPQARAELQFMEEILAGRTPIGDVTHVDLLTERNDALTPEAAAFGTDGKTRLGEVKAVENLINREGKRPFEAVKRNVKHAANQVVDYNADHGITDGGVVRLDARGGTPVTLSPEEVVGLRNAINGELKPGGKLGAHGVQAVEVLYKDANGETHRVVFQAGPDGLTGDTIEDVDGGGA